MKSKFFTAITSAAIIIQSLILPATFTGLAITPQNADAGMIKNSAKVAVASVAVKGLFSFGAAVARGNSYNVIRSVVTAESDEALSVATQNFVKFINTSKDKTAIADWMVEFIGARADGAIVKQRIESLGAELSKGKFEVNAARLSAQQAEEKGLNESLMMQFEAQAEKKALVTAERSSVKSEVGAAESEFIELNEVRLNSGGKGNWSKELNKPEPNTKYIVDDNKIYVTDSVGRTTSAEANLNKIIRDRNQYQQRKVGNSGEEGDHGGHLIASIFDGPGEKLNMVPMNSTLNQGAWKAMENMWSKALNRGESVDVKITPNYKNSELRPYSFDVKYKIGDNIPKTTYYKNE